MGLPAHPLTLSVEQIDELNKKLAATRHDINNHLSMMMAASELIQMKPEMASKMADKLMKQPSRITELIKEFSAEFERTLGITRP
jgi:hypothetical protein